MATKRRPLNEIELANLERFKSIWLEKKQILKLTQEIAGHACGWNGQSAFSQYLCGIVPLNVEAVLRLAKVLAVHPAEIMPDINDLLPEGCGDTTAVSRREREARALANLILDLSKEQRVVLETVAETFVNSAHKQSKEVG